MRSRTDGCRHSNRPADKKGSRPLDERSRAKERSDAALSYLLRRGPRLRHGDLDTRYRGTSQRTDEVARRQGDGIGPHPSRRELDLQVLPRQPRVKCIACECLRCLALRVFVASFRCSGRRSPFTERDQSAPLALFLFPPACRCPTPARAHPASAVSRLGYSTAFRSGRCRGSATDTQIAQCRDNTTYCV